LNLEFGRDDTIFARTRDAFWVKEAGMSRPTDSAISHFDSAQRKADRAKDLLGQLSVINGRVVQLDKREEGHFHLASAVRSMAKGLEHLTVGLRATYILLDEVNQKLPK
jgi:hypothetical protein